jgi:transcriptional regulator with XRE-family HTH domain
MNKSKRVLPLDTDIGAKIKARRIELGVSQVALAGRIGISFQQVAKYERLENRVSASRLSDIAAALGTPVSWFLEGPCEVPMSPEGDRATLRLMTSYKKLAPDVQRAVRGLIAAIAGTPE